MNVKPWFAFHLPLYTFPDTSEAGLFERVVELAQTAEEVGFAQVSVMDHLYQIGVASLGVEGLSQKSAILDGYCAEIGRDPTSIERTMGAPVVVVASEDEADTYLERVPPERRPNLFIGTPKKAAERMQPYLDAGFTGFTFNNSIYRTTESMAAVGELLHLVGG